MRLPPEIASEQFLLLTTFRKTGEGVPTPIWFVELPDGLYIRTGYNTGKVKRIRHTPRATLTPCTRTGKPLDGPLVEVQLSEAPLSVGPQVEAALHKKYGFPVRIVNFLLWLRRVKTAYLKA